MTQVGNPLCIPERQHSRDAGRGKSESRGILTGRWRSWFVQEMVIGESFRAVAGSMDDDEISDQDDFDGGSNDRAGDIGIGAGRSADTLGAEPGHGPVSYTHLTL